MGSALITLVVHHCTEKAERSAGYSAYSVVESHCVISALPAAVSKATALDSRASSASLSTRLGLGDARADWTRVRRVRWDSGAEFGLTHTPVGVDRDSATGGGTWPTKIDDIAHCSALQSMCVAPGGLRVHKSTPTLSRGSLGHAHVC